MNRILLGTMLLGVASCNSVSYRAVTIRPTYSYEEGCAAVKISGAGFGSSVTAKIGDNDVESLQMPADVGAPEHESGFVVYGVAPAGTAGEFNDVSVTSDGETDTIPSAFYYLACPAPGYADIVAGPGETVVAGDAIYVEGCSIDSATMQVELRDPANADYQGHWTAPVEGFTTAALTSICRTAQHTFTAPDMVDGTYFVYFVDVASGAQIWPPACPTEVCDDVDLADEDGDLQANCSDMDCVAEEACWVDYDGDAVADGPAEHCNNGIDDDGDGNADFADTDCDGAEDCADVDGADEDGDATANCEDTDCSDNPACFSCSDAMYALTYGGAE